MTVPSHCCPALLIIRPHIIKSFRPLSPFSFHLDAVATVVDAEAAALALSLTTGRRQLAAADLIIINKCDLVPGLGALADLEDAIEREAPGIRVVRTRFGQAPLEMIMDVQAVEAKGAANDLQASRGATFASAGQGRLDKGLILTFALLPLLTGAARLPFPRSSAGGTSKVASRRQHPRHPSIPPLATLTQVHAPFHTPQTESPALRGLSPLYPSASPSYRFRLSFVVASLTPMCCRGWGRAAAQEGEACIRGGTRRRERDPPRPQPRNSSTARG